MARKESITIENILTAAFEMTREEGFQNVTARKLAAKAGCSTQPIFRVYKNMEELGADLFENAAAYFEQFCLAFPQFQKTPFVNLGMAYIEFAIEEKHLFELLFMSKDRHGKSMYELLNGRGGAVVREINKAKEDGCKDPSGMFMKMWMVIHGAACMTITDDYDLSAQETVKLLADSYSAFLQRQ